MKRRHIIRTLSVCIALLLLSACRQERDGLTVADEPAASVQVSFTLTTASGEASARVGADEAGAGYENYIDIAGRNFRFLLFDVDDDTFVYSFTPQSVTPTGASGGYAQTYEVEGEMPEAYADFNYKVVVLANWPTYPDGQNLTAGVTTIRDICSAYAYGYTAPFVPSESQLIPFYGVATISTTLRPDLSTHLGSIDLLRAMCKVEVKCSADGFTLKSVTLNRYSTKGMCAPLDVDGNTEPDWETNERIHLPADNAVGETLPLTSNPDGSFIAYVPEYNNAVSKDAYLEVTLQDAAGKEVSLKSPNIYFRDYMDGIPEDGSDYDLIRNHWYQFDITTVDDGELTFEYRVLLWDEVESQIGWNPPIRDGGNAPVSAWRLVKFDVNDDSEDALRYIDSDYKDARAGDEEAVFCYVLYPRYEDTGHLTLENAPSYAAFNFHLSEPKGAVWKAWLSNTTDFSFGSGDYKVTDVVRENADKSKIPGETHTRRCAITGIARDEDYQIQVTANHPWTDLNYQNTSWGQGVEASGREVYTDLHISISTDGGETWHDLAINREDKATQIKNGEEVPYLEHTYWINQRRFAGGNDYYIRIWQLKPVQNKGFDDLIKDLPETHSIKDWWKGDDSN